MRAIGSLSLSNTKSQNSKLQSYTLKEVSTSNHVELLCTCPAEPTNQTNNKAGPILIKEALSNHKPDKDITSTNICIERSTLLKLDRGIDETFGKVVEVKLKGFKAINIELWRMICVALLLIALLLFLNKIIRFIACFISIRNLNSLNSWYDAQIQHCRLLCGGGYLAN